MNTTTATQPIYRWNGQYYGFMADGFLIDAGGTYRGWIDGDGTVWRANGKFLGDLVGGEYVLLRQSTVRPDQTRRLAPSPIIVPPPAPNKAARGPRSGYIDGLDACD